MGFRLTASGWRGIGRSMVFLVAFGAVAFGGLLIMLIARYGKHPQSPSAHAVHPGGTAMPYDAFRALLIDLLEKLGLDITHMSGSANEVEIIARTRTALIASKYIVHGHVSPPDDRVTQPEVLRLQDQVRGEGAAKGILITPYAIERDGLAGLEVELELVDGRRLRQLVEEHLPERLEELAKYRGFGL